MPSGALLFAWDEGVIGRARMPVGKPEEVCVDVVVVVVYPPRPAADAGLFDVEDSGRLPGGDMARGNRPRMLLAADEGRGIGILWNCSCTCWNVASFDEKPKGGLKDGERWSDAPLV